MFDTGLSANNKLFLLKDKFVYPAETIQLTRDWVLRTVNSRWRSFKSKLKKQYFNPQERSLDAIMKDTPENVNEHQWSALVGIWCEEKHKVGLIIYHKDIVPIPDI